MGLFSFLFGNNYQPHRLPHLQSIYPQGAILKLQAGVLPIINADKLVLDTGEVCHFVDRAVIVTEKKCRESHHVGSSFRVFSGVYLNAGGTRSEPVYETELTNGFFYITDKRTVFVGKKNGFDKEIKKITAITHYKDGIELQYGDKTYSLFLPDGSIPKKVLDLII